MGIENRKQKRVVLRRDVIINNALKVKGLDLSEGGIYVHTGRSFPAGSVVDVSLPLDSGTLTVRAKVQHSQDGVGMGLMFVGLTPGKLAYIREFIDNAAEEVSQVSRKKILVVDDNALSRRMNRSKLALDGFSVTEAADGLEAITVLEQQQVSLVVLDLYMEKLDGYKVLSIMRQKSEWRDIPVLVLSARTSSEEVDRAIHAGATEFLPKVTTSPHKLSERIRRHLESK